MSDTNQVDLDRERLVEAAEQNEAAGREPLPGTGQRMEWSGIDELRRTGLAVSVWVAVAERVYVFRDRWVSVDLASGIVDVSERDGNRHQVTAPLRTTLIQWALGEPTGSEKLESADTLSGDQLTAEGVANQADPELAADV